MVSSGEGDIRANIAVGPLPGWAAIAAAVCENLEIQQRVASGLTSEIPGAGTGAKMILQSLVRIRTLYFS